MKLTYSCPTCKKPTEIKSETKAKKGDLFIYTYTCGHLEVRKSLETDGHKFLELNKTESLAALDDPSFSAVNGSGKKCYPYQIEGVLKAEAAQLNYLIADAMGLGKTIQAHTIFKRNRELMSPCLYLTRSGAIYQTCMEYKTWADTLPLHVMPVLNKNSLVPGFPFYVMSMDLLGRNGILEKLKTLGIKSVVMDEVQFYKDPSSRRAQALIQFIQDNRIKYRIALSGTPIKNRASEYFTILNILAPEYFRSLEQFKRNWLVQNEKGIYTRINPYRLDEFHKLISRWVIRREKKDVLTNLPELTRDYQYIEIEDPDIRASYNQELDLFDNFLQNTAKITSMDILGWLAKLRAKTGQAKCQNAIEWAREFLDSTDESLAIGVQHRSVRDTLYHIFKEAGYDPLKLSGEDNTWAKSRIQAAFNNGDNRLLIINMIAGGIALNLQEKCYTTLVLERQWNSADEEQFEGRFHRDGQRYPVTATYMIARGTIDEWFHDLVMKKRNILGETLIKDWNFTEDHESLRDLAEITVRNRLN